LVFVKNNKNFIRFVRSIKNSLKTHDPKELIEKNRNLIEAFLESRERFYSNYRDYIKLFCENFEANKGVCKVFDNYDALNDSILEIVQNDEHVLVYVDHEIREINLVDHLISMGKDVIPSRFEDYIVKKIGNGNFSLYNVNLFREDLDYSNIFSNAKAELKKAFNEVRVGITSADALSADTGSVIITDNDGGKIRTSASPRVHIIVAGVEKIYPTFLDAWLAVYLKKIFSFYPKINYINVITGPSRTGDIEKVLTYGAHGPNEIYAFLVDDGRLRDISYGNTMIYNCLECTLCQNMLLGMSLISSNFDRFVEHLKEFYLAIKRNKKAILPTLLKALKLSVKNFICPISLSLNNIEPRPDIDETLLDYITQILKILEGI